MAENEDLEVSGVPGNEWEVVSLTASTYAAAPSPGSLDDDENHNLDKAETSSAMFMSGHFALSSQPASLELSDDVNIRVLEEQGGKDDLSSVYAAALAKSSSKDEEECSFNKLSASDEFPGLHFLDAKKDAGLSIHGSAFEGGKDNLQGLKDFTDEGQSVYSSAAFSSFQTGEALGLSSSCVENISALKILTASEAAETRKTPPDDISGPHKQLRGEKSGGFDLPCGNWWKRRAASFYAQAKEAKAFWPVFIAAAVMGMVILWQREKRQVLQFKWHLSINNEVQATSSRSLSTRMHGLM